MTDSDGRRVVVASSNRHYEDALTVRKAVFVEEQDVPEDLELDEYDDAPETTHVVAYDGEEIVGTARLRPYEDDPETAAAVGKVQRVAVAADRRGDGWGRRLMARIEAVARERGFDRLTLDVQTHARGFYARLGYAVVSEEEFLDAGIPHVEMAKSL